MARVHILDGYKGAFNNFREALIDDLVRMGHEVFVSAPDLDDELCSKLIDRKVQPIEVRLQRGGLNPISDVISVLSIVRALKASRADILLAYSSKAVIYSLLAGAIVKTKVRAAAITGLGYAFVNSTVRGRIAGIFQRMLYRIALRFCHVVIFQNPDDRSEFDKRHLIPQDVKVVLTGGSGVDLDKFRMAAVESTTTFLMMGRLLRSKGVAEYVHAARDVKSTFPEARFLLAGWFDQDNPDSIDSELRREIEGNQSVEYLGRLSDVRSVLSGCAVFVLPSYREGTPRSTLEALATGRAVITTDAPGCRETVKDGENGFLVPVGDWAALAKAMRRYLNDDELIHTHGRASRRLAESRFDVEVVNAEILKAVGL